MSVELKSPFGGAVIEVGDDNVDRFVAAGWEKAGKAPTKKAETKSSAKSDK